MCSEKRREEVCVSVWGGQIKLSVVSRWRGSLYFHFILVGGGGGGESNKISKMDQDLSRPAPSSQPPTRNERSLNVRFLLEIYLVKSHFRQMKQ